MFLLQLSVVLTSRSVIDTIFFGQPHTPSDMSAAFISCSRTVSSICVINNLPTPSSMGLPSPVRLRIISTIEFILYTSSLILGNGFIYLNCHIIFFIYNQPDVWFQKGTRIPKRHRMCYCRSQHTPLQMSRNRQESRSTPSLKQISPKPSGSGLPVIQPLLPRRTQHF